MQLRRSYTITYALAVDLTLAVFAVTSLALLPLLSFSPLGLLIMLALAGALRAHQLWLTGGAFSRRELVFWTLAGLGIPALIWAAAFLLAASLGADLA